MFHFFAKSVQLSLDWEEWWALFRYTYTAYSRHKNHAGCTLYTYSLRWEHREQSIEGPSPVQSRLCGWSYPIKFSIRNLSYSSCSEPSRTVLLPDVMYTRPPPVLIQFTPLGRSILIPPWVGVLTIFPLKGQWQEKTLPTVGNVRILK